MAMAGACLDKAQRNLWADVDRALVALHGCHAIADSSVRLCLGERVLAHPAGSNYLSVSNLKRPGSYCSPVVTRSQPIKQALCRHCQRFLMVGAPVQPGMQAA